VVLARSDFFSDALAGGPLAAKVDGPLLITPGASLSASLDPRVQAEIQRVLVPGGTVYILGGDLALSSGIDTALQALGFVTERIAGSDEFATAVDVAEELGNPSVVFEATGLSFQDALSAVPAAVEKGGAILLTDGANQAPETAAYLAAHPGDTRYAIGGPLAAYGADSSATPVYGQDLYGTSAAVASTFFPTAKNFGAATGADFPDALAGGAFIGASATQGPILLVEPSGPLPPSVDSYLTGNASNLVQGYLFGGPLAVGDDVLSELEVPRPTSTLTVITTALPSGEVGAEYMATLSASGGKLPYSWTITSGSLPSGLSLLTGGVITGTPSAQGTFSFTVQVVDSTTPTPQIAVQGLAISVAASQGSTLIVTTTALSNGMVGTSYSTMLSASGGTPPYRWTVISGALPSGLTLTGGGDITGTPSSQGTFDFTVQVTDSTAPTAQMAVRSLSISVSAPEIPTVISSNWSGYFVGNGPYTGVTGTFTVSSLESGTPTSDAMCEWVGIDGWNESPLIQAGVTEYIDPDNPAYFFIQPWWDLLPVHQAEINITTVSVHAGDTVTVTIGEVSGTEWGIELTDNTNGETFVTDQTYTGPGLTAEWIVEAPEQNGSIDTLAPYTPPVTFSNLLITGNQTVLDRIVMDQNDQQVSTPGTFGSTGFSVAYGSVGPSTSQFQNQRDSTLRRSLKGIPAPPGFRLHPTYGGTNTILDR
jgi:hypothetical protein